MKSSKLSFLFLFLFSIMFLSSFVSAVPPLTTEFVGDTGYAIEANIQDYYQVNEGACVHIYVFNRTNGEQLSYPTVSCMVELTDANGTTVLVGSPTAHEEHFKMCRPATIVTKLETYGLTIVCNSSVVGGYKTAFFEATETGRAEKSFFDNPILIVFLVLFVLLYLIAYATKTPWLGFLSSIPLIMGGIYTMIYGFAGVANLYTRALSVVVLGFGMVLMIIAAYDWVSSEGD